MRAGAWRVAVLIPARNEEQLLPRCLESVQRAREVVEGQAATDVIVVVDDSRDRTEEIAKAILGSSGLVATTLAGLVGSARALAAKLAVSRHHGSLERLWLANTDADCVVPEDWLSLQLSMAQQAHTAVAGIVDVDNYEEHDASVQQLFRQTYLLHPDGTHPHVHGANLGIRADAYIRAGGWAPRASAEDHDLWGRLQSVGEQLVSDVRLKVLTSGRREGRAPMGFAAALAAHNHEAKR